MTNQEAISAVFGDVAVPNLALQKAMIDNEITGVADYKKENAVQIGICAIEVLQTLLVKANITEGDLSISYDRGAVEKLIIELQSKCAVAGAGPRVTGVSPW